MSTRPNEFGLELRKLVNASLWARIFISFRKIALASLGLLLEPHTNPAVCILVLKENPRLFEG
jgi:hypothetical protein